MKKFLIEIFALILLISVVFFIVEYLYKDYKTPLDYKMDVFYKKKDNLSGIIIGNSHYEAIGTRGLFCPEKREINLSFGGQDLYHMMILLETSIPISKKLKYVVLGLDYELLGYNFVKENQEWKDRFYYPYNTHLYDQSIANIILAESNFFRSNRDVSYLFNDEIQNPKSTFIPLNIAQDSLNCMKRAQEHSVYKFNKNLIPKNKAYLIRIIDICKKNGVQLLLLNTPKTECYVENYNNEVITSSRSFYMMIAKRYNLIYIDWFSNDSFCNDDFIDFDHLNKSGVDKLVEKIKSEYKLN